MKSVYETIYFTERVPFEIFKSNVCHHLKDVGDMQFIVDVLENQLIDKLYQKKWCVEGLYMLAMLDYISRINDIPICTKYENMRSAKLDKIIYPIGIYTVYVLTKNSEILKESYDNSIPEFKRFNIVENEVRNIA